MTQISKKSVSQNSLADISNGSEKFWSKVEEKKAIQLFQKAAQLVPAYRDFLKKQKVNAEKIKTLEDFKHIPITSKKTYLREYPLEKLVWPDLWNNYVTFAATSGSTGRSFYFPRSELLDMQASVAHELFLRQSSFGFNPRKPTLVIVGFGMGVWIGGLITYKAFELAAKRGNSVAIITPGINKQEIFNALKNLAPKFHQTILAGYPPFVKDIIDEAADQHIDLKKLRLRLLFAAESFPENFRDYLYEKLGKQNNLYRDTMNIYGTADIGAMAFETPLAIFLRRLALQHSNLFSEIFSRVNKTPTLAQYFPQFMHFETEHDEIILTGDNTIPLIRYAVGDHGGVHTFTSISEIIRSLNIHLPNEIKKEGLTPFANHLPYVYVYERNDFSISLYGLQIYPETIREVLMENFSTRFLTGKFSMISKFDAQQNQYFEINIETKQDGTINKSLRKLLMNKIIENLLKKNSEYRELYRHLKERALPKLVFLQKEHPKYFKAGAKQKWVLK